MPSPPASEKIIVALDVPSLDAALPVMRLCAGRTTWVKIGLQLFTAEGPEAVRAALDCGFRVFLDLKIHDIPNTAAHAVQSAARHGAQWLTVHTLGGPAMLDAAAAAARDHGIGLLGVTLLTSMDAAACREIGLRDEPAAAAQRLAQLAASAGLAGAVCSGHEAAAVRGILGPSAAVVTPGIRPRGTAAGDQRRVMGPAEALRAGASHVVIGRAVLDAPDPAQALDDLVREIQSALA